MWRRSGSVWRCGPSGVYRLLSVPDHPEVVRGSLRACIAKTLYTDHAAVWFLEINRRDFGIVLATIIVGANSELW